MSLRKVASFVTDVVIVSVTVVVVAFAYDYVSGVHGSMMSRLVRHGIDGLLIAMISASLERWAQKRRTKRRRQEQNR